MVDHQTACNLLALKKKEFEIKFDLSGSQYVAVENIGTGAYGVVCSAIHKSTNVKVAIKKIPDIFDQPVIAKRTYREIKILKHFKHDNIISIREILKPDESKDKLKDVYIVLDLMESDMHRVIHSNQDLTDEHVQYFLYQLLRGLKYILSANIIHRDLKPSNLLVNENCDLKIGDFGMARAISTDPDDYNFQLTQYVATRWYRAPEIMMAQVTYTGAVDMWSVGCIFAEMLGRRQIFPGKDYVHQLKLIFGIIGTPDEEFLKLVISKNIRNFISGLQKKLPEPLNKLYPKAKKKALNLLSKMLILDPRKRISVDEALQHLYLNTYHDPDDEPICIPVFDFNFEKKELNNQELKDAIMEEIMEYHKPKTKSKLSFNFKPVSSVTDRSNKQMTESTLITHSQGHPEQPEIKLEEISNDEKSEVVKVDMSNLQPADSDIEMLSAKLSCTSIQETKNDMGATDSIELKISQEKTFASSKPIISSTAEKSLQQTLNEQLEQFNKLTEEIKYEEIAQQEKLNASRLKTDNLQPAETDVVMLSAKLSETAIDNTDKVYAGDNLESTDVKTKQPADLTKNQASLSIKEDAKPLNAKEILKHALLKNALSKQKADEKPKPVTAMQRQKEREEKKKKKLEKAKDRKKKQKQKESPLKLSSDDLDLLARWKNMQPKKSVPSTIISNTSPSQTAAISEKSDTSRFGVIKNGNNQIPLTTSTVNLSSHAKGATTSSQDISCNPPNTTAVPVDSNILMRKESTHTITNVCMAHQPNTVMTTIPKDTISSKPVPSIVSQQEILAPNTFNVNITGQEHSLPFQNIAEQSAFCDLSRMNTNLESTQEEQAKKTELVSILEMLQSSKSEDLVPHASTSGVYGSACDVQQFPPPYNGPMHQQYINTSNISLEVCASKSPSNADVPFTSFTFGPESLASDKVAYRLPKPSTLNLAYLQKPQNTSKCEPLPSGGISEWLMKNREELTLGNTPKGTGGGYGVGPDLDAEIICQKSGGIRQDSAPLSASLIRDWLDLTGNMNVKDLEMELGSPIVLPDI